MSIETHSGNEPLLTPVSPTWGELVPTGQSASVLRFVLDGRIVTFPIAQLLRWEHNLGPPETLVVTAGREQILIEGRNLAEVRTALDLGRLGELRLNYRRDSRARPGPSIRTITIESA